MMKKAVGTRDLMLQENLWRLLVKLSFPGIAGMLVMAVNGLVDALYVGRFVGSEALAGVSMVIPVMVINTALLNLIVAGSASLLSRSIGSKDITIHNTIFAHVLVLCVAVSLVLMSMGIFFAEAIITLTGARGRILDYAVSYYRISQSGCFFSVLGLAGSGLIRAEGKIKQAMLISMTGVVLNLLLNPLFIVELNLGVAGSAYATILSMAVYCGLTINYFLSRSSIVSIHLHKNILSKSVFQAILSIGISSMLMQLSSFIRQLFLFKAVTRYGNDQQLIVFSAIYRLFSFSVIPVFGILQALQPVVGINYGAGEIPRSKQAAIIFLTGCLGLMIAIALPTFIFPQHMLELLIPGTQISAQDIFYLRLILLVLLIAPFSSVSIVFLQATGNAKWSAWLSGGREVVLFLPLIVLVPSHYGSPGVYYTLLLENILYLFVVLLVTRHYMEHMPALDRTTNRFAIPSRFFPMFNRKTIK